jgi:hypothetical protein
MEWLEWILKIALLLIGMQYVAGPVVVWWTQKLPERYKFVRLDSEEFLTQRSNTFLRLHRELVAGSFGYIGSSELKMSLATMYFSIYYNPQTKLCCTLSSAHSKPASTTQIEFTQLFDDGSVVNVSNNPLFDIYPAWDRKIVYRFPNTNDFGELLSAANKLIEKETKSVKVGLKQGSEFETIENYLTQEMMRLISMGLVSGKAVGGERHLTLKGAIIFTWKLCWPVKSILSSLDEKRSIRALQGI